MKNLYPSGNTDLQGNVKTKVGETLKAMGSVNKICIFRSVSFGVNRELLKKSDF